MALNIVLVEPEIPNNTGNIGRLSLATGSSLHLIKPYGFELTEKRVKRAGLDYWQFLNLKEYQSIDDFWAQNNPKSIAFLSSHGKQSYLHINYQEDTFLIFGKESVGLGKELRLKYSSNLYHIPILNPKIRSLNLANAVSIVTYEGLRQIGIKKA